MTSLRDDSTGVFNWAQFVAFANLIVARAGRHQGALGVLIIAVDTAPLARLDNARELEETSIRVLAGALQATVRSGDMIARHGPRSFAVLAQDAREAGAIRLAERIQAALPEHLTTSAGPAPFSVSLGVATLPEAGTSVAALVRHAEAAVREAVGAGGNRAHLYGTSAVVAQPGMHPQSAARQHLLRTLKRDQLAYRRAAAYRRLTTAHVQGLITGIALHTEPGSCPNCLDAARDIYRPVLAPALPLIGCVAPGGCRCSYTSPAFAAQWPSEPVPVEHHASLAIPSRLWDAAFLGVEPQRSARAVEVAEYLEHFPLLSFHPEVALQEGEAVVLARPARQATEQRMRAGVTSRGPLIPLETPFFPWVREVKRPPSVSRDVLPQQQEGIFYVTTRRVLFVSDDRREGLALLDLTGIELLRNGIACLRGDWTLRHVFLLDDPLQTGLFLARAVRLALYCR